MLGLGNSGEAKGNMMDMPEKDVDRVTYMEIHKVMCIRMDMMGMEMDTILMVDTMMKVMGSKYLPQYLYLLLE